MGGYFNCRPGDLNKLTNDTSLSYTSNVDINNDANGRNHSPEIYGVVQIMHVNYLKYKNKDFSVISHTKKVKQELN